MSLVSMSKYDSRHQDGDGGDGMEEWCVSEQWVDVDQHWITLSVMLVMLQPTGGSAAATADPTSVRQAVAG